MARQKAIESTDKQTAFGGWQIRVRRLTPQPPQLAEHSDQALHAPNVPVEGIARARP